MPFHLNRPVASFWVISFEPIHPEHAVNLSACVNSRQITQEAAILISIQLVITLQLTAMSNATCCKLHAHFQHFPCAPTPDASQTAPSEHPNPAPPHPSIADTIVLVCAPMRRARATGASWPRSANQQTATLCANRGGTASRSIIIQSIHGHRKMKVQICRMRCVVAQGAPIHPRWPRKFLTLNFDKMFTHVDAQHSP